MSNTTPRSSACSASGSGTSPQAEPGHHVRTARNRNNPLGTNQTAHRQQHVALVAPPRWSAVLEGSALLEGPGLCDTEVCVSFQPVRSLRNYKCHTARPGAVAGAHLPDLRIPRAPEPRPQSPPLVVGRRTKVAGLACPATPTWGCFPREPGRGAPLHMPWAGNIQSCAL